MPINGSGRWMTRATLSERVGFGSPDDACAHNNGASFGYLPTR